MAKKCESCGKTAGFLKGMFFVRIKGKDYCSNCAKRYIDNATSKIQITTTNNIEGYKVKKYIDIESVEIVIGTGVFSEFNGDFADFFGMRSTDFENKLQKAKEIAFKKLKYKAFLKEGNAVIGIDMDYTEFSGNRIGVIVNGTVVEIEPIT